MLRYARRLSESYGRQLRGSGSGDQLGEFLGYHVRVAVSIPGSYAGLLGEIGHLVASLCHIFT